MAMAHAPTGLAAQGDVQLMTEIRAGNADAFAELYDRYSARAYRIARSVCREDGHAEEAVQDAFMSIWRRRSGYEPDRGSVAAWLLTGVRYRAIDVLRRQSKHASRRTGEDALYAHPASVNLADQTAGRDEAHQLRALLTRLPDAQREVITLAFYAQLTHTEIATALSLPTGTVKGRMRLGLDKLRRDIEHSSD
jgi:RNA polymerase sigma-70 factor, ECF subfamily